MPENFESQKYRDELAEKIKEFPKEERKEVLGKAKEIPHYWQARTKKIKERQDEEEIDDGFGVLVKKKTLYHGSGISGIKKQGKFNKAEEDTVGSGIYFTSDAKDAIGYARLRSERENKRNDEQRNENSKPVIYESSVENMKLLDLRKDKNVKKVLNGFKQVLIEKLKDKNLKWNIRYVYDKAIEAIDKNEVGAGNLREATFNMPGMFSDYVKSLGYEGLITFEGGEGGNGNHDTYLIFNPEKVKINQEHNIRIK